MAAEPVARRRLDTPERPAERRPVEVGLEDRALALELTVEGDIVRHGAGMLS